MSNTDLSGIPILDDRIIAELRTLMAEDFADLLETFLSDMSMQLARMDAAINNSDVVALFRGAHALKSTGASLGALRLSELNRRLEELGYDETKREDVIGLWKQIQTTAEQTRVVLQTMLDG